MACVTSGQRSAVKRAINRFERAVDAYAFLGEIPVDSEEALAVRECIETEYRRSKECLNGLIDRYMP